MPPYMYQVDSDAINNTITTLRDSPWNDVTTASSWRELGANMALKDMEFQHNLDMWNRQNEYNTPAAQMQRFAAAGLNPNLIYSQGNPGNATSAPQYNAPTYSKDADFKKLNSVLSTLGTVAQMASMVSGIVNDSFDLQLKSNQVAESDMYMTELKRMASLANTDGKNDFGVPFSDAYIGLLKPSAFNAVQNGGLKRALLPYQQDLSLSREMINKYQLTHLLPLVKEFNKGKIDLQGINLRLNQYQEDFMNSLSPGARQVYNIVKDMLGTFLPLVPHGSYKIK